MQTIIGRLFPIARLLRHWHHLLAVLRRAATSDPASAPGLVACRVAIDGMTYLRHDEAHSSIN